jgi:hypothetical protein
MARARTDPTILEAAQAAWDTFPGQVASRVTQPHFRTDRAASECKSPTRLHGILPWARQDSNLGPPRH